MAITLSTGASVSIAKTYGAAINTSTVTNAANAVVTTASAHSFAVGDYIEVSSGWGLLDKRVVRCMTGTTGSTVVLEGIDTTDTAKYPAGTGIGSVRKIMTWTALSQIKGMSASGGSQNFADITSIADTVQRQVPTTRSAISMTIDAFDDPTLAWYADVNAADNARNPYGLLMAFPNSSKLCANAYWSLMRVPTMATNEALMTQISLSYASEPVRYST
jgi:hypothetical protein